MPPTTSSADWRRSIKAAEAKVRETVEQILADIEERKDAGVRELSQQFD
jgi:sulfopropanediol 3-dehydrogenase